jgi:hypothetical protein
MELIRKNALVAGGVLVFFALPRAGANRPARRGPATGELVLQCGNVLVWSIDWFASMIGAEVPRSDTPGA